MDFIAHELAQALVDKLVALQRTQPRKFAGNDQRRVVRVVIAEDFNGRLFEAVLDQGLDF